MNDLVSCNLPIIEQIKNISINGQKTARELYHAEGFCAHHNSDLWAHTTPVGAKKMNSSQYAYWNLSGGWLCRHLFEHYEYTLDKDFLAKYYPIMKESAIFYTEYLREDEEGRLVVNPSLSPENSYKTENGAVGTLCKSASVDNQIITVQAASGLMLRP
jgi:alpha-L-fucosidase 2